MKRRLRVKRRKMPSTVVPDISAMHYDQQYWAIASQRILERWERWEVVEATTATATLSGFCEWPDCDKPSSKYKFCFRHRMQMAKERKKNSDTNPSVG